MRSSTVWSFSYYAPTWGAPSQTAFLILIGLNIEICLMFAVLSIIWTKILLVEKKTRILGIPTRVFIAVLGAVFCVFVEYLLYLSGAFTWDYTWWGRSAPWLIFLFGYLTFFIMVFWVFDKKSIKNKLITVGSIWTIAVLSLVVFIPVLHWI